eukprot:TRINITY_DN95288_c0_g1_i1.p1 TRINITY_DN95288_c0_g1~~TRINITY_DN95288_c0_g1_i1.p1  ORF type:complete len:288 (+),score=45.55 TRINITY_DN95288_c0_g1_i1:48-911(+)
MDHRAPAILRLAEVLCQETSEENCLYSAAKHAEARREFDQALRLYIRVIHEQRDKAESALKDAAVLLHSLGRSAEGLTLLKQHEALISHRRSYENLLNDFRSFWRLEKTATPGYLRTVELQLEQGPFGWAFCQQIFRNSPRVRRIVVCGRTGLGGFVEFATYSAARKALRQCQDQQGVVACWAPPEAQTALLDVLEDSPSLLLYPSLDIELGGAIEARPSIFYLPDGCRSVADLEFMDLLPKSLWRALSWDLEGRPERRRVLPSGSKSSVGQQNDAADGHWPASHGA